METDEATKDTKRNSTSPMFQSKDLTAGRASLLNSENPDSDDFPARKTTSFDLHLNALYRSVKFQAQEFRSDTTKITGKFAVDLVSLRIEGKYRWACTTESTDNTPIDIFAITCQQPYKIALIQVKSAFHSRGVSVKPEYLESERGPIWIVVATVNKGKSKKDTTTSDDGIDELEGLAPEGMEYTFLIFTHRELKKFIDQYREIHGAGINPKYAFNVPTQLNYTIFEKYQNAWWKIKQNSRLYG
jgi:hypothetical protein